MKKTSIKLTNSATIKIDNLNLLKGIFNLAKDLAGQKYTSIPSDSINTIQAIKLEESAGNIGWKLISRSLVSTLIQLLLEKIQFFDIQDIETYDLDKQLNELLLKNTYTVNNVFFEKPHEFSFLQDSKEIISNFLELFELEDYEINNIMDRFNSYFTLALIDEYRTNIDFYKTFEDTLKTPFYEAEEKIIEWFRYREWIEKQINESVFGESFGLKQIYIPLKAYYTVESNEEKMNFIVDLKHELLNWINSGTKDDAIRIIRGGPGYGKSSFLKMFASDLAKENYNVLFIPLHHINIDKDMVDSIKNYLTNSELLKINPFDSDKLIIIFDGLDELSMQGKTISESAHNFMEEIQRQTTIFNTTKLKLQIIVSGRDIVIQQNENKFRKEKQIIRLLPYYLNEKEQEKLEPYDDKNSLLNKDQRDSWWKKYGFLKQKDYENLPQELQNEELDDITSQPLLNYLIALSYERGKVDFKDETNLNIIYEDLLIGVYERAYDSKHKSLSEIEKDDFQRILEEIGLATWHGDGRKTTVSQIELHFKEGGLHKLLEEFIGDAEQGVVSLLASFYFKKSGSGNTGDETFEFTHKSFGEFLTAKRIMASIEKIHSNFSKYQKSRYSDEGLDIKESLTKWLSIFSTKEIDTDLHKFIDNEIQLIKDINILKEYQITICTFINYILENGLPIEKLDPRPETFYKENKLSLNAEKALIILHGTISKYTDEISIIEVHDDILFSEWISRLLGQRISPTVFILRFFNNLNFSNSSLYLKDLSFINLQNSILRDSKLFNANLEGANLEGANLEICNLRRINLRRSSLAEANLSYASLQEADLKDADLRGTDLKEAKLRGADLRGADLQGADLRGADLKDADLEDADLEGADLQDADLRGADLQGANLKDADLKDADLEGVDLNKTLRQKINRRISYKNRKKMKKKNL